LSDFWPHGAVSAQYGVLRQNDGTTERALFVIDGDGVICYIDIHDIDQQPDNEVLRGVLRGLQAAKPQAAPPPKAVPSYDEDEIPEGGIVLYCTRWCKDCKKAQAWLEDHGLQYSKIDVDYNMTARNRARQWGNGKLITPTIDFQGTIVLDYKVDQYEEALKKIKA
jgi:glutaredoxin